MSFQRARALTRSSTSLLHFLCGRSSAETVSLPRTCTPPVSDPHQSVAAPFRLRLSSFPSPSSNTHNFTSPQSFLCCLVAIFEPNTVTLGAVVLIFSFRISTSCWNRFPMSVRRRRGAEAVSKFENPGWDLRRNCHIAVNGNNISRWRVQNSRSSRHKSDENCGSSQII